MTHQYNIQQHQHRAAAWEAATAASASPLCRFKVSDGVRILEAAGFDETLDIPNCLPLGAAIDQKHREWRQKVIKAAERRNLNFTHGIAAKLINCYLKTRVVCGGHHNHPAAADLHPPVDALLLGALAKAEVGGFGKQWRIFLNKRWSKFDSDTYQSVIEHIRKALPPGEPLWKIEQHWVGHQ